MSDAPPLSQKELDICVQTLKNIEEKDPTWLPTELDEVLVMMPREGDEQDFRNCVNMVTWIRTVRRTQKYGEGKYPWFPSWIDMKKSSLFWRLRSGKNPLPSPPPTSFSYPWYDVIENANPHWVDGMYVQHVDETLFTSYAYINQTPYIVKKWVDAEETIPSVVAYGDYLFHVFKGPHQVKQVTSAGVEPLTIYGWWIQRLFTEN